MTLGRRVRLAPRDGHDEVGFEPGLFDSSTSHPLAAPLRKAILRTRQWLIGEQHPDGYWEAELEGDTLLESEYILLLAYLGKEKSERAKRCAQFILEKQTPEGGWAMYPGGGIEISVSVKNYFALKLTGHDPSAEYMQRARNAIVAAGGADRVNSFTRFYLALLGQISYDHCPEVPPEVMLLPTWFPINIYRISSWSRTIFVPLSIVSAQRPVRQIEPSRGIRELFCEHPENWPPLRSPGVKGGTGLLSWDRFFRVADRTLRFLSRRQWMPLRNKSIEKAKAWMLERFEGSDGLGAIFPPIIWSIVALDSLGYAADSPEIKYNLQELEDLVLEGEDSTRLQPCRSPVWDTAITLRALAASGLGTEDPTIETGVEWLLANEVRRAGDWSQTVNAEPGGWCFEHNNEFYPDLDDTAMCLLALRTQLEAVSDVSLSLPPRLQVMAHRTSDSLKNARAQCARIDAIVSAAQRAVRWTLAMQNSDGGWGAFDRDNDAEFLCYVPFADHNAMIDPSTPDLTARVLEGLAAWGYTVGHPAIDRAVAYLRQTQDADGSWFGRWGVNYIYGTWQTLVGLTAVGVPTSDPAVVAGANWLKAYQQPSGGWGESPDSYADPRKRGQGSATASQTAWAVLGLIAAGEGKSSAVARGIRYLIDTQVEDGTWDEPEFTGTGFPQVFYLRYHMYPIYFPLMALSQWAVAVGGQLPPSEPPQLRMVAAESFSGRGA